MKYAKNWYLSQHSTFSSPLLHFLEILWSLLPYTRNLSSPAVEIPVSLSGNNWALRWPYSWACSRCLLDVSSSRRLESLSICANHYFCSRLYFVFSRSVNNDRNKRGQNSRPVDRTEIQTNYNFKANIPGCYYHFSSIAVGTSYLKTNLKTMWLYQHAIMSNNCKFFVHKNFLVILSKSYWISCKFMLSNDNRTNQFHWT